MFPQSPNPESIFVNIQGNVYEFKRNVDPIGGPVVSYDSICDMMRDIVESGGVFRHKSGDGAVTTLIKVPIGAIVQVLTGEAFAKWMAEAERAQKLAQLANGGLPAGRIRQ